MQSFFDNFYVKIMHVWWVANDQQKKEDAFGHIIDVTHLIRCIWDYMACPHFDDRWNRTNKAHIDQKKWPAGR